MNTCDPADGVIACNDDGDGCFGGASVTGDIVLEQSVCTLCERLAVWIGDMSVR